MPDPTMITSGLPVRLKTAGSDIEPRDNTLAAVANCPHCPVGNTDRWRQMV
jgi:hypothetical protein